MPGRHSSGASLSNCAAYVLNVIFNSCTAFSHHVTSNLRRQVVVLTSAGEAACQRQAWHQH
jgi:hypothetical protein